MLNQWLRELKESHESIDQRFIALSDQISRLCSDLQRDFDLFQVREELVRLDNVIAMTMFTKWSTDVLLVLASMGSSRFEDIRKSLAGISGKVLSRKLKFLEEKNLIKRTVLNTRPPRATYQLTEGGIIVDKLAMPVMLYLRYLENVHQSR